MVVIISIKGEIPIYTLLLRTTIFPGEKIIQTAIIIPQYTKLTAKKTKAVLINSGLPIGAKAAATTMQAERISKARDTTKGIGGRRITQESSPPAAAPASRRLLRQERERKRLTVSSRI